MTLFGMAAACRAGWGWLLLCACLLHPFPAQAHKPSDAYLNLRIQGALVEERLDIALRDLDRDLALDADDNGALQWGEVRSRWADIDHLAVQGVRLQSGGRDCQAGPSGPPQLDTHSDGRYAVLLRRWTCPGLATNTLAVTYALFSATDPLHRGVVRVQKETASETAVLVPGAGARSFFASSSGAGAHSAQAREGAPGDAAPAGFVGFVKEGVHHILIGTDHILFLLALLLPALLVRGKEATGVPWVPAASLKPVLLDVLRVVTAFTVAHSITLALAAFDVVDPPSRWVESIIAASVLLAALNNLFPLIRDGRWKLTFAFGLVHGFGFAGALKDLGLRQGDLLAPLLGFNLGVELGQLTIVALFVGAMWKLRASRWYRSGVLGAGSCLIAAMALVWLVERAFDLQWL